MATQIVMDHNGDSRYHFDPLDIGALAEAEERFRNLTGAGFTAAARTAAGESIRIASFDPNAEETLFFARLIGGQEVRWTCCWVFGVDRPTRHMPVRFFGSTGPSAAREGFDSCLQQRRHRSF